jgi:hypothetical protein
MDKIWVHITAVPEGGQKATLKVLAYKTEDEMMQSTEFLQGQNDIAFLVPPQDILVCDRTAEPIPNSDDFKWNRALAASFSTSNKRRTDRSTF